MRPVEPVNARDSMEPRELRESREPREPIGPANRTNPLPPYPRSWYSRWQTGRWQDWVNLFLGAWVFISGWVFSHGYYGYYNNRGAGANGWNAWITGAIIFFVAAWAITAPRNMLAEMINIFAGLWLFISPWVLGFAGHNTGASWNDWVVGAIVFFLALWAWWAVTHTPTLGRSAPRRPRYNPPRRRTPAHS